MGKLQIDFLGTSFSAQTDEDDRYLGQLSAYYKAIIDSIQKSSGTKDPLKISILAGITLTDKLFKEKQKSALLSMDSPSEEDSKAEEITLRMIDKISSVLEDQ
ncbi:MAG: cell division protein ZapA [Treponema sp.]|nr:cell division protein ZapA [Treponema sp.]